MAQHVPLASDATLRDAAGTLDDKVQFIADAYAVICRRERMHGPVGLQLGVSRSSKGKRPNYRIVLDGTDIAVVAIDGNTHEPWPGNDMNPQGDWSTKAMNRAEMGELLLEVRKKKRPKSEDS